jgi:hypothetical protein
MPQELLSPATRHQNLRYNAYCPSSPPVGRKTLRSLNVALIYLDIEITQNSLIAKTKPVLNSN